MYIGLWGFLSVSVICGVLLMMFIIYQVSMQKAKELEIEALKNEDRHFKAEIEKS